MDQDLFKQLNANLAALNKNMGKARGGSKSSKAAKNYSTTRLTTPDIGGFRAFFNAAIGDAFIDAVEEKGFQGALSEGFEKVFGVAARKEAISKAEKQLQQLETKAARPGSTITQEQLEAGRAAINTRMERKLGAQNLKLIRNFGFAVGVATFALIKFRGSLLESARQLGGVSLDDALQNRIRSLFTSIRSILSGEFVGFGQIEAVQGSVSGEFGQLINTGEAARLAQIQQRLGISTQELTKLQRALQGTGLEAEDAVNEFRDVGIVGRVAAVEIAKNADAVARAGGRFNEFIVRGVANAKRLGLEFAGIEQTLTGISTDFTGTVESFSSLRAVIPGFAADFGQLFSTALYGSTDDFIGQIRGSLQGAGVSDVSQLNRTQLSLLEQATGFGAAEIQRILDNEDVFQDEALDLDTRRNSMLNQMNILLGTLIGVTAGGFIMSSLGPIGALIGAVGGGVLGAGLGYGAGKVFNDFVFRPGSPPVQFSPQDTLIGVKDTGAIGGTTQVVNDYRGLENKVDQLIMTMNEQTNVMRTGMSLEVKGIDRAIVRKRDAVIRNQ